MDRGRTAKPSFDADASGCCCLENIRRTSRSIWASGTKNVPFASASGALVLIGFIFHDKQEPSGLWRLAGLFLDKENSLASGGPFRRSRKPSGVWQAFSSIKKTLWRLAGLFLDKENSLASGGPFRRSRKPSGARLAFPSIKKTLWCSAGFSLDKENPLVLGWLFPR